MGRKIEVFSDGSEQGKSLIELVNRLACPKCEIIVHDSEKMGGHLGSTIWMDGKEIDINKLTKRL